jgi:hypothetical protein
MITKTGYSHTSSLTRLNNSSTCLSLIKTVTCFAVDKYRRNMRFEKFETKNQLLQFMILKYILLYTNAINVHAIPMTNASIPILNPSVLLTKFLGFNTFH